MESIEFKKSISISAAGKGCRMRLGDIDGDGRMELVLIKPADVPDSRYFPLQAVCATAFSLDGELLWQIGDPGYNSPDFDGELPAQIYDIDKDGKNELIIIMNNELLILDGKTSGVKKRAPLPDTYACDSITIADLEGSGYAQNIIIKNKYSKMWAFDINLNILWTFEGNIGHCPVVYDINDDGRDEIIAGYNVLDGTGTLLWKADMPKHANSVCVCDLYKNGESVILICGPDIHAYSADGVLLWKLEETARNVAVGSFRTNTDTNDILILDTLSLFDSKGGFLYEKNETVYLPTPVNNFDGKGQTLIAGHKKEDICTTLYDGYMRAVYTLPTFGNIVCGDLLGSGISQVIIYNDDTAEIYSYAETDFTSGVRPYSRPQPRQYYNLSVHNTLPFAQISTGYLVDDFASQNILKWAETYANLNLHNSYSKVSRSEFVLLLASLLNIKEDFSENFADVSKDSTYYDAVGSFKKLDILSSDSNMFLPDRAITVEYANSILEKLSIPLCFNFDAKYELSKQDTARLILSLNEQN